VKSVIENKVLSSVHEVTPIFSYPCKAGGDIRIYVVKTKLSIFAIAAYKETYENIEYEFAFSVQTLPTGSNYEVYILLVNAENNFSDIKDREYNPFSQLLWDIQALNELYNVIYSLVKGEQNE